MTEAVKKQNYMDGSFFGSVSSIEESRECTIMNIMKERMDNLKNELREEKLKLADTDLAENNWMDKYEQKTICKVIEGKINILSEMLNSVEDVISVMNS